MCFDESKARDFEKLTDLVLTSNTCQEKSSRKSMQDLVRINLEMCAMDLTKVNSSALFNEHLIQDLSTG